MTSHNLVRSGHADGMINFIAAHTTTRTSFKVMILLPLPPGLVFVISSPDIFVDIYTTPVLVYAPNASTSKRAYTNIVCSPPKQCQ